MHSNQHRMALFLSRNNHLKFQFNIDGIPLCKSGQQPFWSILARVINFGNRPAITIFQGNSKPDVNLFASVC